MAALLSKPGITNASFGNSVPSQWSQTWFQNLIKTGLQLADVRNAVGVNGIVITGNITQYATIGFGAPVTLPGPVTINAPASGGSYTLTVNANTSNQAGILLEGTGGPFLLIEDLGANQAYMQLQATNASGYLINCSYGVGSPGNLQFQMGNVTRMTLANTGGLTVNTPTIATPTLTVGAGFNSATPAITTPGFYYASTSAASVQYQLNATGLNYGYIGTSGSGTWVLGYTGTSGTLGTSVLTWGTQGVTINPAGAASYSLLVNAPSGNFAGFFQGYGSSGNSFGLLVEAGYTGDNPVYVTNYGNTNLLFAGQGNGSWFFPLVGTTAAAANVTFAAGTYANSILKSTSSIRYKKNVRTLDTSAHLMKLRPVVYNSTAAADDDSVDHLGLVAEEVADVDPRLVHFEPESLGFEPHPTVPKTHVQKFGPKRPDGVQYERLTVLLLDAFQKLRAEVDALKASQK